MPIIPNIPKKNKHKQSHRILQEYKKPLDHPRNTQESTKHEATLSLVIRTIQQDTIRYQIYKSKNTRHTV